MAQEKLYHMKSIVVTGTDTEVGKTYVSCLLIRKLRNTGLAVGAWKPVCSGAVRDDSGELRWKDVDALAEAVGETASVDAVCSQRFEAPVAPNIAAEMEGRSVDEESIRRGPAEWNDSTQVIVIEGAGGILSPISDSLTTADLGKMHGDSMIVVSANRLGVINHTLLTVEAAEARGLNIAAVVLNDAQPRRQDSSVHSNERQLHRRLSGIPVFRVGHQSEEFTSVGMETPDLTDLLLRPRRDTNQ